MGFFNSLHTNILAKIPGFPPACYSTQATIQRVRSVCGRTCCIRCDELAFAVARFKVSGRSSSPWNAADAPASSASPLRRLSAILVTRAEGQVRDTHHPPRWVRRFSGSQVALCTPGQASNRESMPCSRQYPVTPLSSTRCSV